MGISHLSSISIGFSNINHQFCGTPIYGNPLICTFMTTACTGAIKSIQILISVCVDRCSLPGNMHNRLLSIFWNSFTVQEHACRSGQVQNVQSCLSAPRPLLQLCTSQWQSPWILCQIAPRLRYCQKETLRHGSNMLQRCLNRQGEYSCLGISLTSPQSFGERI